MSKTAIKAITKDEIEVYDRWDRAGDVRVATPGHPDLTLIKFMTAYGGQAKYDMDLSHLTTLLQGEYTIKGFIDAWVTPVWKMVFSLNYAPDSGAVNADWVCGIFYQENLTRNTMGDRGMDVQVEIPPGPQRVMLHYYVSGHCTYGIDADEFVKKNNVIYVDDIAVLR